MLPPGFRIGPWRRSVANCADHSTRIARGEYGVGDIPRHDAAGSDHGTRPDPYARENNRAAADPDVRSDVDRLAKLFSAPLLRVEQRSHITVQLGVRDTVTIELTSREQ